MTELFDSLSGRTRSADFCAVFNCAVCSRTEAASGVISGVAVELVGVDVLVKLGEYI